MATFAIGDVQGCSRSLALLLERVGFDPACDRVWLVGDLVNRGPGSLDVLRWAYAQRDSIVAVLGNHDLHLLSVARAGKAPKRRDTLADVLAAPDREQLLDWLCSRPLIHRESIGARSHVMVHAGLPPFWSSDEAAARAAEVAAVLGGHSSDCSAAEFLAALRGPTPDRWDDRLEGAQRLRFIVKALTRMRACSPEGTLESRFNGPPAGLPKGYAPWFGVPHRRRDDEVVVCGHWAALGLHRSPGVLSLDSGCVWGNELTAVCLEDGAVTSQPCADDVPSRT